MNHSNRFGIRLAGEAGAFMATARIILIALIAVLSAPCTRAAITFTNIASFDGTNGATPVGTLVQGKDGYLYGVCATGGPYPSPKDFGGVFRVGLDGVITNLAWFNGTNGAGVMNGLVEGPNGNFYGTTFEGGPSGDLDSPGTLYKVTPQGLLTTLVNFNGTNGLYPRCALILASDGNLYGTTQDGGRNPAPRFSQGCGTVFRIAPDDTFTTIYNFDSTNEIGYAPDCGLMEGRDHYLYGATVAGGLLKNQFGQGVGAVFKMTLDGSPTLLGSFDGTNGDFPLFPLLQGSDGNIFGTSYGGTNGAQTGFNLGNVFQIAPGGGVSNLYSFDGTHGSLPRGMVQCADGNFYGMTGTGGLGAIPPGYSDRPGTVFKLTPDGNLTILVNFNGTNGAYPFGGLLQASDGNLYGMTRNGGQYDDGTIFRLSLPLPATFKSISISQTSGVALTWSAVASQTYQVQYRTDPIAGNWTNLGSPIVATNGTMTTLDAPGTDSQRFYRVAVMP